MSLIVIIIFILGLIIGSFLNVVIYRYNTGRTLSGRSGCLSCGKGLRWYELVPVLSFFLQRGRCRQCYSKISWQYPLVELTTGLLFVLIYTQLSATNWLLFALYAFVVSVLMVITVYDFRHQIIPDLFVFLFILTGLVAPFFSSGLIFPKLVAIFWGGLLTALPLFLLWAVSRGRWLGFGDVKLALGMGIFLGPWLGFSSLMLAFWLGAIVGLTLIGLSKLSKKRKRGYNMKSELPFAPFLIISFLITLLFNFNVINAFFF
jgi:leader peptidase (prepilin peptidase)/N-methyltransferase